MKNYFLILAICCAMAFAGCGKDPDITPPDGGEEQTPNGDDDNDNNDDDDDDNNDNQQTPEEDPDDPMVSMFPDPNFRAYVLTNFDTDGDGNISQEEAEAVMEINVYNYNNYVGDKSKLIKSLEGIQYFSNLTDLRCVYNSITTLNVSGCTQLRSLYCSSNQLTKLDVSGCTQLKTLSCYYNQLTKLDVSGCTQLKLLYCNSNKLTTLDVSKNTQLTDLYCYSNQLTALDVSKNTQLKTLSCYENQLTALDVSKNTQLKTLYCYENQLTTLDVSKNTQLIELSCSSNQLTTLDVSKTNLGNSTWYYPLDCAPMSTLKTLYLKKGWSIPYITEDSGRSTNYIPAQTEVLFIDDDGQISDAIPDDMEEVFPDPLFREYVLTRFDKNKDGRISQNEAEAATSIDVRNSDWYNESKMIKSLEGIQFFKNITYLDCCYNQLRTLDVSKNTKLTTLYCSYNQLTTLDVSKNTKLTYLDCNYNQLTTLDVSKNTQLETLLCYSNRLTTLDVSNNTQLTYLFCGSNQLTTLDVSKTNLGNSPATYPLGCAMETLKTLYLKKGWSIKGITEDNGRSTNYIPAQTEIVFVY